jgi:hypothetical protein
MALLHRQKATALDMHDLTAPTALQCRHQLWSTPLNREGRSQDCDASVVEVLHPRLSAPPQGGKETQLRAQLAFFCELTKDKEAQMLHADITAWVVLLSSHKRQR